MRKCIYVLLLFAAGHGVAATLSGRVVGVSDGDTITVLVDRDPVKVRLTRLDGDSGGVPCEAICH